MTCRSRATWGLWALFMAALFSGCSNGDRPPLGQVSGTVTLDGEPLYGVIVMFKPDEGRPATGVTDAEGKYQLVYRYGVNGAKIGPNTISFAYPTGESGAPIPEKYAGKTTLKEEVKSGSNTFNFALSSKD